MSRSGDSDVQGFHRPPRIFVTQGGRLGHRYSSQCQGLYLLGSRRPHDPSQKLSPIGYRFLRGLVGAIKYLDEAEKGQTCLRYADLLNSLQGRICVKNVRCARVLAQNEEAPWRFVMAAQRIGVTL